MKPWPEILKQFELVTAAPQTPLISLDELKRQTRNLPDDDVTDDDNLYRIYCAAAEELIEKCCEVAIRQKTYDLTLACWPCYSDYAILRWEMPPLQSVTHVKYYDVDDILQTLDSSKYELWLGNKPPQILIRSCNIPAVSTERSKAITIRGVCGYPTSVPSNIQQTILELVAFWYQHREAFGPRLMPEGGAQGRMFHNLLDSIRWRAYP